MLNRALLPLLSFTLLAGCYIPSAPKPSASVAPAVADSPTITSRKSHTQGPLEASPKATDWAIDGPGYFEVRDRASHKTYYTRNGSFEFNAQGELVTREGYQLLPPISLKDPKTFSHINEGGSVWALEAGQYVNIGRISTVLFAKPDKLKALGGRDGYFEPTLISGQPSTHQPKQNGAGFIVGAAHEAFSLPPTAVPERDCKGSLRLDDSPGKMDFAIEGKGFFTFLDSATGDRYYSRRASLRLDGSGQLINEHGYQLDPSVVIPPGQQLDRIESDGSIWSIGGGAPLRLGKLTISLAEKPQALVPLGFTRGAVYLAPAAAGKIKDLYPGNGGAGFIRSGVLENCGQEVRTLPEAFLGAVQALNIVS